MVKRSAKNNEFAEIISKIEQFKKEHKLDLSSDEDLSVAVMNLVSLEEHFFFTGAKTGKRPYYDMLAKVREMRKHLLKRLVKNQEGEVWCLSKHLLAACMRLIEVGTKYQTQGDKKEAEDLFSKAYDLYSLFWGINLELVDIGDVKKIGDDRINKHDKSDDSLMVKLNTLVQQLVDCCKE